MQIFLNVLNIATLGFYVIIPLVLTKFFKSNRDQFAEDNFKLRFSEAIKNLNPKSSTAAYYFLIFCYRRLVSSLLIVLLPEHSSF